MIRKVIMVLIFISSAFSQNDSLLAPWSEFLEDDQGLAERIQQLLNAPLSINSATASDLASVPFLNEEDIRLILQYREEHGFFKKKSQLKPVLGSATYALIKAFVTIKKPKNKRAYYIHKNHVPLKESAYAGLSALYDYNKFFFRVNSRLSGGFISQKDAGEEDFADYINGYLTYRSSSRQIILGKFNYQFGMGLVFANPFSALKSIPILSSFKGSKQAATPYLTSLENNGQFGFFIGSSFPERGQIHFFYTRNLRDGRISGNDRFVTGFSYDGYHRTNREKRQKNLITERITALALAYDFPFLGSVGLLAAHTSFNPAIRFDKGSVGEADLRRRYFHFSGNHLSHFSLRYERSFRHLQFNGEVALSVPGSRAWSQSVFWNYPHFKTGIRYWQVDKNFQSPYGRIFDSTRPFPQAEQGFYYALSWALSKWIHVEGYRIFKKQLWRGYFEPLPGSKLEWLLQNTMQLNGMALIMRIRYKQREQFNNPTGRVQSGQWIYRLQYTFRNHHGSVLKFRWVRTRIPLYKEKGSYIFQELRYSPNRHYQFGARITFFRTDSYQTRLYEYEQDLPGSFANFAFWGEGYRWYVLLKSRCSRWLTLWLKLRYLHQYQSQLTSDEWFPREKTDLTLHLQLQMNF